MTWREQDFDRRIGRVFIPVADEVQVAEHDDTDGDFGSDDDPGGALPPTALPGYKLCRTKLKEGCYAMAWTPKVPVHTPPALVTTLRGTLRVEQVGTALRFSGDLYRAPRAIVWSPLDGSSSAHGTPRLALAVGLDELGADTTAIPIYARNTYRSYLKGTGATLTSTVPALAKCTFTLRFDEYNYKHPDTGFSGSFSATPDRALRFVLNAGATPDTYTGKVYAGTVELGAVALRWVSRFFRRAALVIHTLNGAEKPGAVPGSGGGTESFSTAFASAGWDLSVTEAGTIPLPASLTGVQDPNQCWSQVNSARLMESVPGYNPAQLDAVWRAHLIAVPAKLGCSRGRMFDNGAGDTNAIAREGALTHSHDGYPAFDSPNFGVAENGLQKDFPRAFLRSACHEVGHTFNQIHQELEGGRDNSIMTTTPGVADALASVGQSFPKDINIGFNQRVRRHLVHLPDPAVRPGAMEFFGAAVTAPEADNILWPRELKLRARAPDDHISLGEALVVEWVLSNRSAGSVLAPEKLDIESLVARVSVTDPDGSITFLRPAAQDVCPHNPLTTLPPSQTREGSTRVFWGRDGFTFRRPGRHAITIILLWDVSGVSIAVQAETEVWVDFPATDSDNRIASLMLDADVGRAVALGMADPGSRAAQRLGDAARLRPDHPAIAKLQALGLGARLGLPA